MVKALVGVRVQRWLARKGIVAGRGAYVSMSAEQMLSEFFYGFPVGTFMVSYNWEHPDLPRRMARELLPEKPPKVPNKTWLDVEQLIPGTMITPACRAAVTAAKCVFVFRTKDYMASKNCRAELQTLLHKPPPLRRGLIFEYADLPSPDDAEDADADGALAPAHAVPGAGAAAPAPREEAPPAERAPEPELSDASADEEADEDAAGVVPPAKRDETRGGGSLPPLSAHEREALHTLPVVKLPSVQAAEKYSAEDMLHTLIAKGSLSALFCDTSPRINASWLATASLLVDGRAYGRSLARFAHVYLAPLVIYLGLYLAMLYIASESLNLFGLEAALTKNILEECLRPWRCTLRAMGMPDAGLLLLVLRELGVLHTRVHVVDMGHDRTITSALELLDKHSVIKLVAVQEERKTVAALAADEHRQPPASHTLCVIDLDKSTPADYVESHSHDYVAWSVKEGFGRLHTGGWAQAEFGASIVAKPEAASLMLETILCRILSLALSRADGPECVLTAGGEFEVDFKRLQLKSAQPEENSPEKSRKSAVRHSASAVAGKAGPLFRATYSSKKLLSAVTEDASLKA